ncbi:hypothetical protein G9A89_000702, partial [Geosiphon pyriformis]
IRTHTLRPDRFEGSIWILTCTHKCPDLYMMAYLYAQYPLWMDPLLGSIRTARPPTPAAQGSILTILGTPSLLERTGEYYLLVKLGPGDCVGIYGSFALYYQWFGLVARTLSWDRLPSHTGGWWLGIYCYSVVSRYWWESWIANQIPLPFVGTYLYWFESLAGRELVRVPTDSMYLLLNLLPWSRTYPWFGYAWTITMSTFMTSTTIDTQVHILVLILGLLRLPIEQSRAYIGMVFVLWLDCSKWLFLAPALGTTLPNSPPLKIPPMILSPAIPTLMGTPKLPTIQTTRVSQGPWVIPYYFTLLSPVIWGYLEITYTGTCLSPYGTCWTLVYKVLETTWVATLIGLGDYGYLVKLGFECGDWYGLSVVVQTVGTFVSPVLRGTGAESKATFGLGRASIYLVGDGHWFGSGV